MIPLHKVGSAGQVFNQDMHILCWPAATLLDHVFESVSEKETLMFLVYVMPLPRQTPRPNCFVSLCLIFYLTPDDVMYFRSGVSHVFCDRSNSSGEIQLGSG